MLSGVLQHNLHTHKYTIKTIMPYSTHVGCYYRGGFSLKLCSSCRQSMSVKFNPLLYSMKTRSSNFFPIEKSWIHKTKGLTTCVSYEDVASKFLPHREELVLQVYQTATILFIILRTIYVDIVFQGFQGLHIQLKVDHMQPQIGRAEPL